MLLKQKPIPFLSAAGQLFKWCWTLFASVTCLRLRNK